MAKARTPRHAWIDAALQAVATGGPEAVRIEALAAGLGVSKGGFYWHFADRQALLDELLDAWEQAMVDDVIERVDADEGDGRSTVQRLFDLAPTADFAVELGLRDWGRRDAGVRARLRRVDERRLAWLRTVFARFCDDADEVVARSMLAYSLMIGGWFVDGGHDERTRTQVFQLALDHLLRVP